MMSKTRWIFWPLALACCLFPSLQSMAADAANAVDPGGAGNTFAAMRNPSPGTAESIASGRGLFASYCALCHGAEGRGHGPALANLGIDPGDLVQSARNKGETELALVIFNGYGNMAGWKGALPEPLLWDLVNFVVSLGKDEPQGAR